MTTVSDTSGQLPRGKITCQMERNPGRCVLGVWRRGAKRVPRISSSIVATDWATPDFGWANRPWRWRRLALMAWLRRCLGKNWGGSPRKRDARTYLPKKKKREGVGGERAKCGLSRGSTHRSHWGPDQDACACVLGCDEILSPVWHPLLPIGAAPQRRLWRDGAALRAPLQSAIWGVFGGIPPGRPVILNRRQQQSESHSTPREHGCWRTGAWLPAFALLQPD